MTTLNKSTPPLGHVYVFSNPAMPGYLKIGYTSREVEDRANELSKSTEIPIPFKIEYSVLIENHASIEKKIHKKLKNYRVSPNKEFFLIETSEATSVINTLIYGSPEPSLGNMLGHLIYLRETYPNFFKNNDQEFFNDVKALAKKHGLRGKSLPKPEQNRTSETTESIKAWMKKNLPK